MAGNQKRALVMTKRLAELAPNHPRAKGNLERILFCIDEIFTGNLQWYEERMLDEDLANLDDLPELKNERVRPNDDIKERDEYERLCRGEFEIPTANASKLYCYLKMDTVRELPRNS
jgi:prolyl 4-hydroxylase